MEQTKQIKKVIRWGDVCLIKIDSLPEGPEKSSSKVILQAGSGGNPHSFTGGNWYPKVSGNVLGYLVAKKTKLFHAEHSPKGAKIEDGVYEVRRQVEFTEAGEQMVED